MLYVSPQRIQIFDTTFAASAPMEPGVPMEIPSALLPDALAKGAVPYVEGEVKAEPEPVAEVEEPTDQAKVGAVRVERSDIFEAIKDLLARNTKNDFTASGRPRVGPLSELVGRKLTTDEVTDAWESYKAD